MAGKENFDSLEIYKISLRHNAIKRITKEDLLYKIGSKMSIVFSENRRKSNGSTMMNKGRYYPPKNDSSSAKNEPKNTSNGGKNEKK